MIPLLSVLVLTASAQTLTNPRISIQGPAAGAAGAIRLTPIPFSQPGAILAPLTLGAPSVLPAAFIPKVQSPAVLKAPEAVQAKTAQEMSAFQAVLSGEGKDRSVEGGLKEAYEGSASKQGSAESVLAEPAVSQPSGLAPAAPVPTQRVAVPAPKSAAPGESTWQKVKRIGGNLLSGAVGLYGGWKIADVAYSVFVHRTPLAGGLAAAALLAGAAVWSRKIRLAGKPQRPVYPTFIATFGANVLGNLLWTLTGSPLLGLGLGLALGVGLGLYAGGAFSRGAENPE